MSSVFPPLHLQENKPCSNVTKASVCHSEEEARPVLTPNVLRVKTSDLCRGSEMHTGLVWRYLVGPGLVLADFRNAFKEGAQSQATGFAMSRRLTFLLDTSL